MRNYEKGNVWKLDSLNNDKERKFSELDWGKSSDRIKQLENKHELETQDTQREADEDLDKALEDLKSKEKKQIVEKSNRKVSKIKKSKEKYSRSKTVEKNIQAEAKSVEDTIANATKDKNPVARGIGKIMNFLLKTES